jgi:hypothetical protein
MHRHFGCIERTGKENLSFRDEYLQITAVLKRANVTMRHTNPWQDQELKCTGPRPYTFIPYILQDFYGFTGLISTVV